MDSDELDQWLDDDDSVSHGRTPWQADTPDRRHGTEPTRRPPWKWLGLAGAAIWAVVMGVVFLGGDGAAQPAATPAPPDGEDLMAAAGDADVVASPTGGGEIMAADRTVEADDDATAPSVVGDDSTSDTMAMPPGIEAGAVSALRLRLTVPGDVTSYLEWATPVATQHLGAGVWLVVMEAIWLEGSEDELTVSRQGRWAVPIADDGRALSPPWPHPTPPAPAATATPTPPSGTVRVSEAAQALVAAGWADVDVVGSDVHPLLDDVIVVMVEGIPPAATKPIVQVVWLREDATGTLGLIGAAR